MFHIVARQKKSKESKTLDKVKLFLTQLQQNISAQLKSITFQNSKIKKIKEKQVRQTENYLKNKQGSTLFNQEIIISVNEDEQNILFELLKKQQFGQSEEKNQVSKQLTNLLKVLESGTTKENQSNIMLLLKGLINQSVDNTEGQGIRQTELIQAGFLPLLCNGIADNKKDQLSQQYIAVLNQFLFSNQQVQDQFYDYLEQDTENSFLLSIRKQIEDNLTQLFEFETNLKSLDFIKKVQNSKHIVASTCESAQQSEPQLEQFTKLVEQKKKSCISCLELFRLSCEGHNLKMQLFLQKQVSREGKLHSNNFNMIHFFAKISMKYLKILNNLNVDLGEKVLELLIEVMQGPCEQNQIIISQTNLLEQLEDFLLDLRQFRLNNSRQAKKNNQIMEQFCKFCDLISVFKLSLFEGNNDKLILDKLAAYFVPEIIFERLAYLQNKKNHSNADDNVWTNMYSNVSMYFKDRGKYKSRSKINVTAYEVCSQKEIKSKESEKNLIANQVPEDNVVVQFSRISLTNQQQVESQENLNNLDNVEEEKIERFTETQKHDYFQAECYNAIILIKSLKDPHPELAEAMKNYLSIPENKIMFKAKKFFGKGTLSIEIMNARNELERIYFQKPSYCKYLSLLTEQEFFENVNRENINEKLGGLLGEIQYFENEMKYFKWLKSRYSLSFSLSYFSMIRYFNLILAITINLIILLKVPEHNEDWSDVSAEIQVLGIIQLAAQFLIYGIYMIFKFPLDFKRGQGQLEIYFKTNKFYYYNYFISYLISSTSVVYYTMNIAITFLALEANKALYSLLLFAMIEMSPILRNVVRSITLNLQQLGLTLCLGIALVYMYSIIAYSSVIFRESFEYSEDEELKFCTSPLKCFSFFLNNGLRSGGGIGDVLVQPDYGDDHSIYVARLFYDLTFFIILIVIWMNIIFGIIIDTFAALRDEKNMRDNDQNNKCFICDIDRGAFEQLGISFQKHRKKQHEIWNYAFYIIHLNSKDKYTYNGSESYISGKIENNDISWFPVERSMALEKLSKQEQEEIKQEK